MSITTLHLEHFLVALQSAHHALFEREPGGYGNSSIPLTFSQLVQ